MLLLSNREFEIKGEIGGVTYDNDSVIDFDIEDIVIPSEDFTLGSVIPSRLTLAVRADDTIATNAKIIPWVRLNGASGWTDWLSLGAFYIDSRTYQNKVWKFVCFDKLILSQQLYVSALVYPATMAQVFNEICSQLGYAVDSSVVINPDYMIPYKDLEISMRTMLGYISSAHASSIRMTNDEKIAFVDFDPLAIKTPLSATDYFKVDQTNPLKIFSN